MDSPRVYRGLLLVGMGLRSLFMAVLLFGVIIYGVYVGELSFDLAKLLDARLLIILLPSYAAFAGIWLRKRWGAALAVVSCLLDTFWWGWVASYAMRRYGDISLFAPEYAFLSVFYGATLVLAVLEFMKLRSTRIQPSASSQISGLRLGEQA